MHPVPLLLFFKLSFRKNFLIAQVALEGWISRQPRTALGLVRKATMNERRHSHDQRMIS